MIKVRIKLWDCFGEADVTLFRKFGMWWGFLKEPVDIYDLRYMVVHCATGLPWWDDEHNSESLRTRIKDMSDVGLLKNYLNHWPVINPQFALFDKVQYKNWR